MCNKLPGGAEAALAQTSLREAMWYRRPLDSPGGDGPGQGQGEQAKPSTALLMC